MNLSKISFQITAFFIAALIHTALVPVFAQPPDTLWTYEYRGPQDDNVVDIAPTSDGGFVCAIKSEAETVDSGRAVLVKLNTMGQEAWSWSYRDWDLWTVTTVTGTQDGGFILAGSGNTWWQEQAVLRTDSAGNPLWYRYYRVPYTDWAVDIVTTHDGGYALITAQLALLRLNAAGDSLWSRDYGDYHFGYGGELIETDDRGFILCGTRGYIRPDSMWDVQPWICKTDSLGGIEWERRINVTGDVWCMTIASAGDGDYVVAGSSFATDTSRSRPFVARISGSGDVLWTRIWNDVEANLRRCRALPDGGFILGGLYASDTPYFERYYLMKIDGNGNRLWDGIYGNSQLVSGSALAVLNDGSLGIGNGQLRSNTIGWDAWAARTGVVTSAVSPPSIIPANPILLSIYPNPFNSTTQIEFTLPTTRRVSLRLYDVLGREVAVLLDEMKTVGEHSVRFDGGSLSSGVYFCRMEAGTEARIQKIVLMR
ncbi:T9SS C-terminal target domain-containing protein [candidate division KSB1 bacterium]|nr:MAG: T9SS C-terminal target domain-containing protein [candidate division KSB1 bacterium]